MRQLRTLGLLMLWCSLPGLSACGEDHSDSGRLCSGDCTLRTEPELLVLGLPQGDVDAAQAVWAIYTPDRAAVPQYLQGDASWSTEDENVAQVDTDGTVTPVAAGQTWIRADYADVTAWTKVTVAGNLQRHRLTVDGATRDFLLYAPDLPDTLPRPLVIALHGGGGTAEHQLRMSQLNRVAWNQSFMVAYPNGSSGLLRLNTWNGGNCCGAAANNNVDDVGFIRAVVDTVASTTALDRTRIYATGMSNGAILTHRLACEAADLLAAVAPVDGGMNLGGDFLSCQPSRPIPIMMFHGTTDLNYPIQGGDGSGELGVPDSFYPVVHPTDPNTLDDWRALNAAAANGRTTAARGDARCTTYDGMSPVVMCIIDPAQPLSADGVVYDGGGHAWPGGVRTDRAEADAPTRDLDASEHLWTFFAQHALPNTTPAARSNP